MFNQNHLKTLQSNGIVMICKKGHSGLPNQNSIFTLVDGGLQIFCVADGHGVNGHKVSSFAISMLLNYIRNVKGSFFVA